MITGALITRQHVDEASLSRRIGTVKDSPVPAHSTLIGAEWNTFGFNATGEAVCSLLQNFGGLEFLVNANDGGFLADILGSGHHSLCDVFRAPSRNFRGRLLIGCCGGNAERNGRESVKPVHGYPPVVGDRPVILLQKPG